MLQTDKIDYAVKRIQQIYLFLVIAGVFFATFILLGFSTKFSTKYSLEVLFSSAIHLALYLGIKRKKEWVVPLIMIYAAIGLFQNMVHIVHPADSIYGIIEKLVSSLYFIFYAYQIYYFTKSEVKQLFSFKGSVLF